MCITSFSGFDVSNIFFPQEKDTSVFSAVIFTVIQDKKNIKAVKRQQISMNFGPD